MRTKTICTISLYLLFFYSFSQQYKTPKLVVGIVIDQMRYDYLYAYWNKYSEGGFKKLINNGFNFKNTHYNYVPTYTGPGHASIYAGCTPAQHAIIANDWFERTENRKVYCTEDKNVTGVGTNNESCKMSPHRMIASNLADELKIASGKKSKVIGIALKDRSAILPAGHAADAAYWMDDATGDFISSTWYMNELPSWVKKFNDLKLARKFLNDNWNTLLPISEYTESIADDNVYEKPFKGEEKPVFPHKLPEILKAHNDKPGIIKYTPFGNTITKELALAALQNEKLGKREVTDMLCISFSSPDYIGHQFGPKSIELEDCYLRLDRDLAEIISWLEKHIGKNNFVLFLTADHAAVDVPAYLFDNKIPSGYINLANYKNKLNEYLQLKFNIKDTSQKLVIEIDNQQAYFNRAAINTLINVDTKAVQELAADFFRDIPGVAEVLTRYQLINQHYTDGIKMLIQMGFNEKRSGDVIINLLPAWIEYDKTGTTHGSPYTYDTHVPLLWYGFNIPKGFSAEYISITDIAPTLSLMLNIPYPNACTGKPIEKLIK